MIRLYTYLPDGRPVIREIPPGELLAPHAAALRAAGGVHVWGICYGRDGSRERVTLRAVDEAGWDAHG